MTGSNGRLGWIMACFAAAQIGTLELAAASSAGDTPFLDDPRENLSGSIYAAEKRFDHPKRPSPLASAQEAELLVYIENGEDRRVPLGFSGPSATVPVAVFRRLGWSFPGGAGPGLLLQGPEGPPVPTVGEEDRTTLIPPRVPPKRCRTRSSRYPILQRILLRGQGTRCLHLW